MNYLKRAVSDQAGFALPMALILVMLGGLLIVPVLDFISTNLNAGIIIEQRTKAAFAAEAGIDDVIWKYKFSGQDPFASGSSYVLSSTVNGMTVTISKHKVETVTEGTRNTIKSVASLSGVTKGVSISQVLVSVNLGFSPLTNGALVSPGDVNIGSGVVINGNVTVNGTLDNGGTINGQVITTPISWPSTDATKEFYWNQVSSLTPVSSITINGQGTALNPVLLGPALVNGDVMIENNSYVKLTGPVYVKGNFTVDNNVYIIMNDQAVFCEGTITFQNNGLASSGSGTFISIGDLYLKNNNTAGSNTLLVGVNSSASPGSSATANRFLLSKFTAIASGALNLFQIRCTGSGNVKVAVYADNAGSPGTLLNAVNTSTAEVSGWNSIDFPSTPITSGTNYWLAANSSANRIGQRTITSQNRYKAATFSSFSFPNPAGTGFTSSTTTQYLLSGYQKDYVLFISLAGTATLENNSWFRGTLAGFESVNVNNNSSVTWQTPQGDINMPGSSGSTSVEVLNYTAQ